jgi:hypothetical protein
MQTCQYQHTILTQNACQLHAKLWLHCVPLPVPLLEVRVWVLYAHKHNFTRVFCQHALHADGGIGYNKRNPALCIECFCPPANANLIT